MGRARAGIRPIRTKENTMLSLAEIKLEYIGTAGPSMIYQRPPKRVAHGLPLTPMLRAWSEGKTALQYAAPMGPIYGPPSPAQEIEELRATQPRIARVIDPFGLVDTRGAEVPSEYRKAANAGYRTLSLDIANGTDDAGDPLTFAQLDLTTELDSVAGPVPDMRFKIDAERRSIANSDVTRIFLDSDAGEEFVMIKTPHRAPGKGLTYNAAANAKMARDYQATITKLWGHMPNVADLRKGAAAIARYRKGQRARLQGDLSIELADPRIDEMPVFDQEMHVPYEETRIEVLDRDWLTALVARRYGRPIDQLFPAEMAEINQSLLELAQREDARDERLRTIRTHRRTLIAPTGETLELNQTVTRSAMPRHVRLTTLRHLRGHASWLDTFTGANQWKRCPTRVPGAVRSFPHIGEYDAGSIDILE